MNVRKMLMGVFTVLTVVLFFLSTSPIATAATTHSITPMRLDSWVGGEYPWAHYEFVYLIPVVDWEVDINRGDHVKISTPYLWYQDWLMTFYPYMTLEGTHEFWFKVWYNSILVDSEEDSQDTSGPPPPPPGRDTFEITVYECDEYTEIYVWWRIKTTHEETGYSVDYTRDGYIDLI